MKALVVLSGGQDSVTCLYKALADFEAVEAIIFNYGQRHRVEILCAVKICNIEKVRHKVVDVTFFGGLIQSALTRDMPVTHVLASGLPATFTPNRNQLFLTIAHAYAQQIGAGTLIAGMCETDYSGYPDCRREFIDRLQFTSNMGSDCSIRIVTPLMWLNKADTFALAADLGKLKEVLTLTHTCYNGDHKTLNPWGYGCGTCPACELRAKGWDEYLART